MRVLEVPSPTAYAYLTDLAMKGTVHEWQFVRQFAKAKFNVLLMSTLFRSVCYGAVRWLSYKLMVLRCEGYGTLKPVAVGLVYKWFGFDILCRRQNKGMNPVFVLAPWRVWRRWTEQHCRIKSGSCTITRKGRFWKGQKEVRRWAISRKVLEVKKAVGVRFSGLSRRLWDLYDVNCVCSWGVVLISCKQCQLFCFARQSGTGESNWFAARCRERS